MRLGTHWEMVWVLGPSPKAGKGLLHSWPLQIGWSLSKSKPGFKHLWEGRREGGRRGSSEQEAVVVPPQSQNCLSQACSSFSRKHGGSPLLSALLAVSQKKQLPEDKPRGRTSTGKQLVWDTEGVSPLHFPPVKREQWDLFSRFVCFKLLLLVSTYFTREPSSQQKLQGKFFPNHTQRSWSFQLPSLEMLTSVLGFAHLAPEHLCGLPSQTQLSPAHSCLAVPSIHQALMVKKESVVNTQSSSPNHFSSPKNSFF